MQIKRFEAPSMSEALRMIKKEFGPDAVILSAKSLSQEKSLFGIKKPAGIEVTAATDTFAMETRALETHAVSAAARGGVSNALKGQNISVRIDDSVGRQGLMNTLQTGLKSLSIRKGTQPASAGTDEDFKEKFKNHFSRQGVEDFFIQELFALFTEKSCSAMEWNGQDFPSGLLKVFPELGISAEGPENCSKRLQVHGFVGPAGSGKTSAMARLTAIYAHQFKQKTGWITFDTKRVAAAAQLQVYGKIIGVPVASVNTVKEFKEALKCFAQMDHIFIDTPGMGFRDARMIAEMSEILKHGHVNMMYLVAGASTKNEDLIQIIKAYQPLSVTHLIISKLDESQTYGNVLNLLMRSKLPVSYFSSGQEIPHSLEKATLEKVVELILNPDRESKPWHVPPGKTAEIIPYDKNNSLRFRDHYVANHNSILFHHPECAWARRIRPENRIVFESFEEAASKEYIPCKTCCSHIPESQNMTEAEVHRAGNGQPYYTR
jgi:flagellar biosynthesis protein FlhF